MVQSNHSKCGILDFNGYGGRGIKMKLTDIPQHVTDLNPPYLWNAYYAKYKESMQMTDDVIPMYHLNYYDGPLSGMINVKGRIFYVESIYGEEDRQWWAAWELTEEELKCELARHELFKQHVGSHTEYKLNDDECWVRKDHDLKPEDDWKNFYEADIPKVNYLEVTKRDFFGILYNPFRNW